jgi:GrpB-like predicted nucleotidyltransferase (UPF0157 family)
MIGCSDGYIAHLENEVKLPSSDICVALAEVFQLNSSEREEFFDAVDTARHQHAEQRLRKRSTLVRGALKTRSVGTKPRTKTHTQEKDVEDFARELAAYPDLRDAYTDLKIALADPKLRDTVLNTLHAIAQQAEKLDS